MTYLSAIVILLICLAVALAVCAPLIYITRKLRGRRGARVPVSKKLPLDQFLLGLVLVSVLFLAFAQEYIAPGSWLGARVTTNEGRFWLSILVSFVFAVLFYIYFILRSPSAGARESSQDSKRQPDRGPNDDA